MGQIGTIKTNRRTGKTKRNGTKTNTKAKTN